MKAVAGSTLFAGAIWLAGKLTAIVVSDSMFGTTVGQTEIFRLIHGASACLDKRSPLGENPDMATTATLTTKQARFVQEYLVDGNGAGAAVRAGYSEKTARAIACELLTKPDLRAVIRERQAAVSVGLEITRQGVIRGFLEAFEMAKIDRQPAVMVSAMASLAKLLGYYAVETKRVEVSTAGDGTMKRLETMSDAELVAMIEAGRKPSFT